MAKTIHGVEVFAVGTWNDFKFVEVDLIEIARNTEGLRTAGKHKPPLKFGHDPNQTLLGQEDGDPALGWVENIRAVGDKLIADFVNVPDIVIDAIGKGLFRQVSVELRHIDNTGWILTAVAIIGADLPAVNTLQDLQAFLTIDPAAGNPEHGKDDFPVLNFSAAEPTLSGVLPMTDEEKKLQEEREAFEKERAEFSVQKARIEAEQAETRFAGTKAKALEPYDEMVKMGQLTPALREEIAVSFEAQKTNFTKTESPLMLPPDIGVKMAKLSATMPNGEQARDDGGKDKDGDLSADIAFANKAKSIAIEKSISYSKAADIVHIVHPEISQAYMAAQAHDVPATHLP